MLFERSWPFSEQKTSQPSSGKKSNGVNMEDGSRSQNCRSGGGPPPIQIFYGVPAQVGGQEWTLVL